MKITQVLYKLRFQDRSEEEQSSCQATMRTNPSVEKLIGIVRNAHEYTVQKIAEEMNTKKMWD